MKKYEIPKGWRITIYIVVAIFAVVGVPLIINHCYLPNKGFETVWGGEELLGYYGSILGAVATIIAVYKTIDFTINNQKEERKREVRPYLTASFIKCTEFTEESMGNVDAFFSYSKIKSNYDFYIPEEVAKIILRRKEAEKVTPNIWGINKIYDEYNSLLNEYRKKKCLVYCKIENIGANNAIFLNIEHRDMEVNSSLYVAKDKPCVIGLILDEDLLWEGQEETPIDINFTYFDIYSIAKYHQGIHIPFFRDENGLLDCKPSVKFTMTPPREIKK